LQHASMVLASAISFRRFLFTRLHGCLHASSPPGPLAVT
jgi:hypothetical protein